VSFVSDCNYRSSRDGYGRITLVNTMGISCDWINILIAVSILPNFFGAGVEFFNATSYEVRQILLVRVRFAVDSCGDSSNSFYIQEINLSYSLVSPDATPRPAAPFSPG